MKESVNKGSNSPLVAAACVVLAVSAMGHPGLGLGVALAVYQGLIWRSQPSRRPAGTALVATALFVAALFVLFSAGYQSGKTLAESDNARQAMVPRSGPEA